MWRHPDTGDNGGEEDRLLLPEATTARYDTKDMPYFQGEAADAVRRCATQMIYQNASRTRRCS